MKKITSQKKTFVNFNKANWPRFTEYTEDIFSKTVPTGNAIKDEKTFRSIINRAAKMNIPAGRIPDIYNAVPSDTAKLIDERDRRRISDPADPSIQEINKDIDKQVDEHRKKLWSEHLDHCGSGTKKLWDTIKALSNGHNKQPNNQGISFNEKMVNDPKKIANHFNAQYTPGPSTKPTKRFRRILRGLKKTPVDEAVVITPAQTAETIKKSRSSKAMGPDDISPVMLKQLGPKGIEFLTKIFNSAVNKAHIPPIWKVGKIIPLLKPKKEADQGPSYRPISLLCPAAKLLEGALLETISAAIPLADHQHGFRKKRSTTTALQQVSDHITDGLNRKKPVHRTVCVAIDLSRAFDTVNHELLIEEISKLELNSNIKRFLSGYLRGRQTYVLFRGQKSRYRKMKQGVPQGGVLSPVLFNLYMSLMPSPPGNIKLFTYADDSNLLNSGPTIEPLCKELNEYLETLNDWFKSVNLFISPSKSSATLFTTFSNELNRQLPITIEGEQVPTERQPKLLGITFDGLFTFKHHALSLKERMQKRNNVLKALTGSSWGKDKEVLLSTYKAINQSILNYGCPIWTPNLSDTHWQDLQSCQNAALRTATGCVKMSKVDHLHAEAKIMPVREHNEMLSKQYLLATQQADHPNHCDLDAPPPDRLMKKTLRSSYGQSILDLIPEGEAGVDAARYKTALKTIHSLSVMETIRKQSDNQVLGEPAPEIHRSERELPRKTRTTLAQLRSGYSSHLKSYLFRINARDTDSDSCPDCGQSPHTTQHLFDCPTNPTTLTTRSLWDNPFDAAVHLGLRTGREPD